MPPTFARIATTPGITGICLHPQSEDDQPRFGRSCLKGVLSSLCFCASCGADGFDRTILRSRTACGGGSGRALHHMGGAIATLAEKKCARCGTYPFVGVRWIISVWRRQLVSREHGIEPHAVEVAHLHVMSEVFQLGGIGARQTHRETGCATMIRCFIWASVKINLKG
jgi:hypothetical protein